MLRKILAVLIAVSLVLSMPIFSSGATASAMEEKTYERKESQDIAEIMANINSIVPVTANNSTTYYDSNNNVVDISEGDLVASSDETTLPEKFDLRDEGRLTSVKDQGSDGFCWNFAATASLESNILTNPELRAALGENPEENLDLSEAGNAWYIHTSIDDESSYLYGDYLLDSNKGAAGGNPDIVGQSLSSGFGAYPEELLPYSSWGDAYSESLRFYSDYRLDDLVVLSDDTATLKERLMEYGAICINYNNYSSNYYYNDDLMESYYDNGSSVDPFDDQYSFHLVAIVGWDDTYSKENFNPLMRPENDGAWLCKNSWGEYNGSMAEGYEGFFWMSYESWVTEYTQFTAQSVDAFDNIYQHQLSHDGSREMNTIANVYTSERDEVLEQICYSNYFPTDITIEIYKLNKNFANPEDGVLLTSFDGSVPCSGTHTIDVPDEVVLRAGDIFSVVVKGNEEFYINSKHNDNIVAGKSFFVYEDQWYDVKDFPLAGYFVLKVYTSNIDNAVYKDKLASAIDDAENFIATEKISHNLLVALESVLTEAKEVLNDTDATQNKVNNIICLLGYALEKCEYSYFEINSMEDFMILHEKSGKGMYADADIVLNTDLEFSGITTPLFAGNVFRGTFDGNGHIISNLNINYYTNCGLFSQLDGATVKNVVLKDCSFASAMSTGTIAGNAVSSVISDCTVDGAKVDNYQDYAGGIVGSADYLTVANCVVKNSQIVSQNDMAGGIGGFTLDSVFENCSISDTEIMAYIAAKIFDAEEVSSCSYNNVSLKAFAVIRLDSVTAVCKDLASSDCYAFIVFEDGKFMIEPYIGEITNASSDEAEVTKVGENYEIKLNEDGFDAYVNVDFKPLNTNNFSFSFDITTDCATLEGYYNYFDESATEVVFPSYIGKLKVTGISYLFEFDSIAPVKSIVLSENISMINEYIFYYCTELENITIPASVTMIGSGAFGMCENLTDVYYGGTQQQWAEMYIGADNEYLINANIHFAQSEPEMGDVNGDGELNIKDATEIQKYLADLAGFDEAQLILADINLDGTVNIKDATYIQKKIANLI